jgi:hypothetical protein
LRQQNLQVWSRQLIQALLQGRTLLPAQSLEMGAQLPLAHR